MADEPKAGEGKKATGARPRPKRDPNQPTPKPAKRAFGATALKLAVGGGAAVVCLWAGLYSAEVGRGPWDWSSADWGGFVTFSREQVDEARAQVEGIDWGALQGKITAQTKALWEQVPDLERKLEERLQALRGGQAKPGPTGAPAANAAAPGEVVGASAKAPGALEQGIEAFQQGVRRYKGSMHDQDALRAARKDFQAAQGHLERAHAEAQASGDAAGERECEEYLMQVQTYLEDCSKRETL